MSKLSIRGYNPVGGGGGTPIHYPLPYPRGISWEVDVRVGTLCKKDKPSENKVPTCFLASLFTSWLHYLRAWNKLCPEPFGLLLFKELLSSLRPKPEKWHPIQGGKDTYLIAAHKPSLNPFLILWGTAQFYLCFSCGWEFIHLNFSWCNSCTPYLRNTSGTPCQKR